MSNLKAKRPTPIPSDPKMAFAYLVSRCGEGYGRELMASGKSATQARNIIIHHFVDFAAGEACRIARAEGRDPDQEKWQRAVTRAFENAIKRTAVLVTPMKAKERKGKKP